MPNGKTVKEVNREVRKEVERIYLEGWAKGVSIPFWDKEGNFYYAASMPEGFLRLRPGRLQEGKMLEGLYKDISLACRVADELRVNKLFADKA